MARSQNQKKHFSIKLRYLVLFLILLALLLAAVGTVAWMRYIRSLQTVTLVQVTNLSLVGPGGDKTLAIDLGDLDVSEAGYEEYVFGVDSVNLDKCTIQLAHTTNIPFTYEIYKATKNDNSFTHDDSDPVDGEYLNKNDNVALQGNDPYFTSTYKKKEGISYSVQENAAPLYWQSGDVNIDKEDNKHVITYFILKVIWDSGLQNNKETDMVYLTVGTGGGAS